MLENHVRFKQKSVFVALGLSFGVLVLGLVVSLAIATLMQRGGLVKDYAYAYDDSPARRP